MSYGGFGQEDNGGLESGAGLVPEIARKRLAQSQLRNPEEERSGVEKAGGALGGIIGGIAGAYAGGPMGAFKGAQTGYSIGSTGGAMLYDMTSREGPMSERFVKNTTRGIDLYGQTKSAAPASSTASTSE